MKPFRKSMFWLALFLTACGSGQQEQKKEKSADKKESKDVSVAAIEKGVRSYIEEHSQGKEGRFELEKEGDTLRLKLVRVHTEYIATLGPQRHFACVDLAEANGDVYDVDFFLEGSKGNMTITQLTVHKLNGKPFYTWEQKKDGTWHRVEVEEASKKVKGVIQGEDAFRFRYKAKLPEMKKKAELWMPVATDDRFQKVELDSLRAPGEQSMLKEEEHGNKILHLDLKPEHSGKTIELVYEVERKEKSPYKDTSAKPDDYLTSTPLIPTKGRFERISDRVLAGKQQEDRLLKARTLFEHVLDTVAYKKVGKYGTGSAKYACSSGKGNCTEFHSYFIALARAAGIPARFSIGASIPSERDKGGINGYHCWAEFYADGKWWPVDISEAKKYNSLKAYYFGHHPANRIELSDGRNLKVEPKPQSGPIKFLAYPLLEIDGKRKPVETTFSFVRKKLS
ncbi:MAG: transglutaminase-like domain-containing protein [Flavobacteriales bacterium]